MIKRGIVVEGQIFSLKELNIEVDPALQESSEEEELEGIAPIEEKTLESYTKVDR